MMKTDKSQVVLDTNEHGNLLIRSKELVDLQSGSREDSKQVRLRGGGEPQTSKNKGLEFPQCKNSTTYFSLGRSNQPDFKYQKTLIY